MITLDEFKSQIADVARPNRFLVTIQGADAKVQFLVKAAALPGRDLGDIDISWQGMKVKLAGDPSFNDLELTIINDYNFTARAFLEEWVNKIANMQSNERKNHSEYKSTVQMDQLGRTESEILRTYIIDGAYPKSLSNISLSMDTENTAEEFTVSFRYDNFRYGSL